jgi:hypothetical protein
LNNPGSWQTFDKKRRRTMTRRKQTPGTCVFCGREMTSGGMSKHLQSCTQRQEAITIAENAGSAIAQSLYHLLVRDAYGSDFWLHLEMNGRATLKNLDQYLRAIWLECCGHLSKFSVGVRYGQEVAMSRKIESVFASDEELMHIYDYGTSSETRVKLLSVREGKPLTGNPIFLMARNNMPEAVCAECGAAAGWYCVDCLIEQGEWLNLCAEHCANHAHDNYGGTMPLVNSPRLGMCGYNGPAIPPY